MKQRGVKPGVKNENAFFKKVGVSLKIHLSFFLNHQSGLEGSKRELDWRVLTRQICASALVTHSHMRTALRRARPTFDQLFSILLVTR